MIEIVSKTEEQLEEAAADISLELSGKMSKQVRQQLAHIMAMSEDIADQITQIRYVLRSMGYGGDSFAAEMSTILTKMAAELKQDQDPELLN